MSKILMVTMGLDIGGAETHIAELSRELTRRGWEVLIASNGGVFVQALEKDGIRHIQMPLHNKHPKHMYQSYRALKELIRKEKPDIVHAHARIPAFITGLVRRSTAFNFVTSAHGVFHVTPVNRFLTNWGQHTVAVSEDIRTYLIGEYGLPAEQISITINGIDTQKFSPETSGDDIIREFDINEHAPVISHVSRIDDASSLVARQLISIAPRIAEKLPGAQILIAGGGDVFDELNEQADAVNEQLGRRCIIMTGPRTDINKIVAAGDIFVGVSRAALEAMSAGKPVLTAGAQGYIGPFGPDKLELAQGTNFCCRGCELPQEEQLLQDILTMFRMNRAKYDALSQYGRNVVQDNYSVKKMTDDYCAVYEKAMLPRVNVLMSGYFGFGNAGDEAILSSTYANVRSLGGNIAVKALIFKPERSAGKYEFGMVDRFRPLRIRKAVKECDVLISGGGSLLQDATSSKSIWYYLTIIRWAEKMGRKVVFYSNGIGPVNGERNRLLVKEAAEKADLLILRDANSAAELEKMGVEGKPLHVTADAVFSYDTEAACRADVQRIFAEEKIPMAKAFAGVSVRDWKDLSPDFHERVANLCDYIQVMHGINIVFIPMQNPEDVEISRKIMKSMTTQAYILEKKYGTDEMMAVMGAARFMLCMRLHTLIFAAAMGVPSIGMVYDPKVRDYLEMLELPSLGEVSDLDLDQAKVVIDRFEQSYERRREKIGERSAALRLEAEKNIELLRELFDECK